MAMRYGYTRVSTAKQDCSNQIDALKAAGCTTIFTERVSAKSTNNRTEFNRLMRALKPGDTVVVTKLDRLARVGICTTSSTTVCGFISFGETWCDTTADVGKLVLTIVGGIAELERKLIQARSEEGIQKARDQGKKFRRPSALDAGQKRKIADSCGQAGAAFGVKPHDESLIGQAEIFEAPEAYLLCRRRCAARSTPAGGSRSFKAPRGGAVRPAGEGECHHHKRPAAWRLPQCVNG
jgi:hypothetical protein